MPGGTSIEALIDGILMLQRKIAAEDVRQKWNNSKDALKADG
jgi:NADH:ubiquinone oxidoreductase subunit B-like Fe-S oxidoreductase